MMSLRNFVVFSGRFLAPLTLLALSACQTAPPLPKFDLAGPGWMLYQGQAIWCPRRASPGVAGDVLFATNPSGSTFVEFTKPPMALAIAQQTSSAWQVEFPLQRKRYAGSGAPPTRLIWLVLPRAFSGDTLPPPWTWQRLDAENWLLVNPETGESLQGFFNL